MPGSDLVSAHYPLNPGLWSVLGQPGNVLQGNAPARCLTSARNGPAEPSRTSSRTGERAWLTYFAASILSTAMTSEPGSSVPVTLTFCAANFSGVCWSLSV